MKGGLIKSTHTCTLFLFLSGSKSETSVERHLIKYSHNVGTQKKKKEERLKLNRSSGKYFNLDFCSDSSCISL